MEVVIDVMSIVNFTSQSVYKIFCYSYLAAVNDSSCGRKNLFDIVIFFI